MVKCVRICRESHIRIGNQMSVWAGGCVYIFRVCIYACVYDC